jgi:cysteine synthase A
MRTVAVEPAGSAVIGGESAGMHTIEGIGAGFVPKVLDLSILDGTISVADDEAFRYAREAAWSGGLLVGVSSGANLAAAEKLASRPENRGAVIVTILPDGAERYLSGRLLDAK